ncbi:DUF5777 family beta-barrel protein [Ferruginibacter albus]|uniref:DUF5777 family beta-barrel protein n=1 Tax=Ferruginibacter albus TaxID=2875540 RepID=UPI001CC5D64E|nr:DUF5777 family beta-barrel protein [Ferruginibacter albus]UAY52271.1 DUF5777 family beta-barrel protein [Ferruginibacter albus]
MIKKILPAFIFIFCFSNYTIAQDTTDVMAQLEKDSAKTIYTTATFKTTRLINGQSVETTAPGVLDLRIDHRFSSLNGGAYEFFGLDNASMRLGFDYGISKSLMVGIGHTTYQKTYDAFFKWKILRQSTGKINMPVTVDLAATVAYNTLKDEVIGKTLDAADRTSVATTLVIGRKFSENLSLQIMPAFIVKDQASFFSFSHPVDFAIGIGGRQKITRHMSLNAEYYYQLPSTQEPGSANVLSIGIDIETGGHVFQLHFTNTQGMTDKAFIAETTGKWDKGEIGFGFNLSRVFNVSKKAKSGW